MKWLLAGLACLILSFISCKDPFTWVLEIAPILIFVPLVIWFQRKHGPFTQLVIALIFVHSLILMIGGHWTYAEVPFGFWMQKTFHFARNHYDRIGHFFQGFVPALATREVLLKRTPLKRGGWLFFLVVCVCLAFSALYELVEMGVSLAKGEAADAFLGSQGDPWDTQWDMSWALIGAITAQLTLTRWQDKQLVELGSK